MSDPLYSGKVAAEWLSRGIWLREAAQVFGRQDYLTALNEASEKFQALREGEPPDVFLWSSKLTGQAREDELRNKLRGDERVAWRRYRSLQQLLDLDLRVKLENGYLWAYGESKRPGADPEWISVRAWYYLKPDPDDENVVRGEGGVFFYVRVINPSEKHSTSVGDQAKTVKAESAILQRLLEWMNSDAPQPKLDAKTECKSVQGYYPEAFERAWKRLPDDRKRARGEHGPLSR